MGSVSRHIWLVSILAASVLAGVECKEDPISPCGPTWSPTSYPKRNGDRVSIKQGVWGDVWFWEGDFMPNCSTGRVSAVGREMRIHELTSIDDVTFYPFRGSFFAEVRTPLLAVVWSDAKGFFQIPLPAGQYSVFAMEDSLYYANRFDCTGNIFPVGVHADSVSGIRFDINYLALW